MSKCPIGVSKPREISNPKANILLFDNRALVLLFVASLFNHMLCN